MPNNCKLNIVVNGRNCHLLTTKVKVALNPNRRKRNWEIDVLVIRKLALLYMLSQE